MAKRRSARLKAKDPSPPQPALASCASDYGSDGGAPRPSRKRQKKATAVASQPARGGKAQMYRGRLSMLGEMPVDVLFEIFSHLLPVDVLHLAWTSKDLRGLLMRRSATYVWREAFASVPDVPQCPADQTLPQWTRLLFVAHCHVCLAPGATKVFFALRIRACRRCLKRRRDVFIRDKDIVADYADSIGSLQLTADNFPCNTGQFDGGNSRYVTVIYSRVQLEATSHSCEVALEKGEASLRAFLLEKRAEIDRINKHAELSRRWLEKQHHGRTDELERVRQRRRNAIIQKLDDLGYGADIKFRRWKFESHPLVRKSQDLTDRIWANIKDTLVELALQHRPERLKEERQRAMARRGKLLKQVLASYCGSLPHGTKVPLDGDIASSPTFRAIWDVEPDATVTAADFDAALPSIPALRAPWVSTIRATLVTCLGLSDSAALSRATTWFLCTACRKMLPCSPFRQHECLSRPRLWNDEDPTNLECYLYWGLESEPWNKHNILSRLGAAAERAVKECIDVLAVACGLDPTTAKGSEMDAVDKKFICTWCLTEDPTSSHSRPKDWIKTVQHYVRHHGESDDSPSFELSTG